MLWKIEDTPHFLVGSIHVRSAEEVAIPKRLIEAFQSTKENSLRNRRFRSKIKDIWNRFIIITS